MDRQLVSSQVDPRGFAGRAQARGDGVLLFHVTNTCESWVREVQTIEVREAKGRRRGGKGGKIAALAVGSVFTLYGLIFSIIGVAAGSDDPGPAFRLIGPAFLAFGLPLFGYGIVGVKQRRRRYRTRATRVPLGTRFVRGPCPPHLVGRAPPPSITVQTPWGSTLTAGVSDGVAQVRPDWKRFGQGPTAANPTLQLMRNWMVSAPGRRGTLYWQPTPADLQLMLGAMGGARGDTPRERAAPK